MLSKSRFLSGLQCEKKLWLSIHRPDLASPTSPAQQHIFDSGTRVGEEAQRQFAGGILVDVPRTDPDRAAVETQKLMAGDAPALFEAAFISDRTIVRVDVLLRTADGWRLLEVKSTTGFKQHHTWDVAVQLHVTERAELRIDSCGLMHLNPTCVYPDLDELFVVDDLTEPARKLLPEVSDLLDRFHTVAEAPHEPHRAIGSHCSDPFDCPFKAYCWHDVPERSIFTIPRLKKSVSDELAARGILALTDLPTETPLSPTSQAYVEVARRGEPKIDSEAICDWLGALEFPLYFLDFETAADAIPRLQGLSPYSPYPFQYSLHVLSSNGELTHREYLHTDSSDPRLPLATALCADIASTGTLIAYNAGFEKGKIRALAEYVDRTANAGGGGVGSRDDVDDRDDVDSHNDLPARLRAMLPRFFDLLDIFKHYYAHPDFLGSNSIKNVLPVLVPDLSYESLEVSDGNQAQAVWSEAIALDDAEKKERVMSTLREYCKLDTLAMVRIHEVLLRL